MPAPLTCFGRAAEETKERNVTRSSNKSNDCNCSFCHGIILQKTGRVRVDLNSEHRGSVAIGPDAVRGRLRELQNILVLVQIRDENMTKYESNLSINFSYIDTDIEVDPPIIAHWFPSLIDYGSSFHHHGNSLKKEKNHSIRAEENRFPSASGSSNNDDDDGWKEKKNMKNNMTNGGWKKEKNHSIRAEENRFRSASGSSNNDDDDGWKSSPGEEEDKKPLDPIRCQQRRRQLRRRAGSRKKYRTDERRVKNNMHLMASDRLPTTRFPYASGSSDNDDDDGWKYVLTMEQKRSSGPRPL
jgi:hypothetical protein